jgi:ubiquinone biosynthesis protein COQ4
MAMHQLHTLRHDALRTAIGVLQTARDPDHALTHGLPMLAAINQSPLGDLTRARQLESPSLRKLAKERYFRPWPDPDTFRSMPEGSLGRCFQRRLDHLGLHQLPVSPPESTTSDGAYLQARRLWTHDLLHLILGIPITPAGEAAGAAYYCATMYEFGSAAFLSAWIFHAMENTNEKPDVWDGIRFGLEVAKTIGNEILAARWEDDWEKSLEAWRDTLLLNDVLSKSPFQEELGSTSR